MLRPKPEIILFGNEEGTAEICQELGLRHIPELARNKFGKSLVNDLFEKAQRLATYDLLCYINADIIVTQGLIRSINIVSKRWKRFVIICGTWELSMENEINLSTPDWERQLRALVKKNRRAPSSIGMDLFLFPRGFYDHIPPFSISGLAWDNWLIFKTRSKRIPLVDTSHFMFIVHPDHERSTHSRLYVADENTLINQRLAKRWTKTFIGLDATYNLEGDGRLRKKRILELLRPRLSAIKLHYIIEGLLRMKSYFKQKLGFFCKLVI